MLPLVAAVVVAAAMASQARAQDLGHKLPGTLGLNAGRQPDPGLYLSDQLAFYGADTLRARDGSVIPVPGFRLRAVADGFGVAWTVALGAATRVNLAASLPVAWARVTSDLAEASLDKAGLGDARLQPLGLGWRGGHFEVIAAYALYIPTGRFEPGGTDGVSRGSFSHEFAFGGTVFLDRARRALLSARAAYELNLPKLGIDLTRGDTVQIQGGAGFRVLPPLEVGVAGYALWQVRDDSGSALPPVLRGSRDRVFGLGPELGAVIPAARIRLALRAVGDFGVRARPQGGIVTLTVALLLWRPGEEASTGGPESR